MYARGRRRSLGLRGCRRHYHAAPHTTHSRKAEYAAPGAVAAAIDAFRGTLPSNICETTSTSASIRFVKLSARMREPSMVPFHWDPRLLQPPKKQPWRPLHISEYANRIIIHTYIHTYLLYFHTITLWYYFKYMYYTMVSFSFNDYYTYILCY